MTPEVRRSSILEDVLEVRISVSTLGSRNATLRQQGRETLARVVLELGPSHFGAVLHELRTTAEKWS